MSEQTIPAPRLGRGYTDPVEYATHLPRRHIRALALHTVTVGGGE